jgi:hypothetical protein
MAVRERMRAGRAGEKCILRLDGVFDIAKEDLQR